MAVKVDIGRRCIEDLREALSRMRLPVKLVRLSVDDPRYPEIITIQEVEPKDVRPLAILNFKIMETA